MKSIRIHQYGPKENLVVENIEEPSPQNKQVKIHIHASGLNHLDVWIREGILPLPLPLIPGSDGSGIVVETGPNVTRFKKGDRVFVNAGYGCGKCQHCLSGTESLCREYEILGEHCHGLHAEFVCVDESQVYHLPENLSFNEGAAFALVYMTAYHMLVRKGQLQHGQDVLIMAGASGVSTAGIQIAKAIGARVITTVGSEEQIEKVKQLGADEVINHYTEDLAKKIKSLTAGKGVEVILEHVGTKVWQACLRSLAKGGRLVTCGGTTGSDVNINLKHLFMKHQQIIGSTMGDPCDMLEVIKLVSEKKCKPVIHSILPYHKIADGHALLEKGGIFGKILLDWTAD